MPRENPVRFAGLNACKHVVENRSAGSFGRLFFNQFGNDVDLFALGEFAQFINLRVNGQDLLVLNIGGFAGVEKKVFHGVICSISYTTMLAYGKLSKKNETSLFLVFRHRACAASFAMRDRSLR